MRRIRPAPYPKTSGPAVALCRSSSGSPSFRLTDAQVVKERADRPEIVFDHSLEVFGLLAETLDTHQEVLWLARGWR